MKNEQPYRSHVAIGFVAIPPAHQSQAAEAIRIMKIADGLRNKLTLPLSFVDN
ncbi:MAG: hypothetical protein AAGE59_02725 [Cyanobacteria bacterium P01_F01_bin.86]